MVDISSTISSANLNILGGPTKVEVSVDYGQRGDRGSLILYGQGKPYLVTLPESPLLYDMYVNLLPSDDEYQWVYQYINTPTGLSWKSLFKLQTNTYSTNEDLSFVDGSVEVWIPIVSVTGNASQNQNGLTNLNASNFNVQYSIVSQNPTASSITIGDITTSPTDVISLPITIKAVEFESDAWSALSGQKTVHLFVTVV
jgi:hypothetical protein